MIITTNFSKVAFYDTGNKEFYVGDDSAGRPKFGPLEKAKLYIGNRAEILSIIEHVSATSAPRKLITVDISVQYQVDPELNSTVFSDTVTSIRNKLQTEFDKLDAQATADIDAMSEKDFRRWKKLRYELVQ